MRRVNLLGTHGSPTRYQYRRRCRGATRGRRQAATDRQLAKIAAETERAQISDRALRADLRRTYRLESPEAGPIEETLARLTVKQASDLIERLMAEADRRSAAAAAGADPETGQVGDASPGPDAAALAAADATRDGPSGGVLH